MFYLKIAWKDANRERSQKSYSHRFTRAEKASFSVNGGPILTTHQYLWGLTASLIHILWQPKRSWSVTSYFLFRVYKCKHPIITVITCNINNNDKTEQLRAGNYGWEGKNMNFSHFFSKCKIIWISWKYCYTWYT